MKKALLLFNLNANSSEVEDMHARNCEVTLNQMFPGTEWLVRTGTEDGEMRMRMLGWQPDGNGEPGGEHRYSIAQWRAYFQRWMTDVHTGDIDNDTYLALIIGHEDGCLGRANANIANKVWNDKRYAGGYVGLFILQNDGSLKVASGYHKGQTDNWSGTCGRLV
jgi:hypothetical protein